MPVGLNLLRSILKGRLEMLRSDMARAVCRSDSLLCLRSFIQDNALTALLAFHTAKLWLGFTYGNMHFPAAPLEHLSS